jgi:UDP-N-acetylmuramate--alanine ligase
MRFLGTRHIHFVGIGGIGMSGIAEVLSNLGYTVSGSDLRESPTTRRLADMGVTVFEGHDPDNIEGAHVVVRSSAVGLENSEVAAAVSQSVPVIPRAEMLAELMRMKHGVAVAGTHGKTTTTSLLAAVFAAGGLDPTVVVGGKLNSIGTNAVLGRGDWMVAEADESDGSFLQLSPTLSIVTNIDPEHLDHYGTEAALQESFLAFINKVPFYGATVLCLDHPAIQQLLPRVSKRYITYGFTSQAELRAVDAVIEKGISRFSVVRGEEFLGPIALQMPGRHNILNALAAIAVALEAGIPFNLIRQALERFEGVQRRFTLRGEVNGVTVIDDYAHHPAEIRATLAAARESYGRRVVAIWQPHRYSRTVDLRADFMRAFNDCALLLVMDVYPAGEKEVAGLNAETLVRELGYHGHKGAVACPDAASVLDLAGRRVRKGDVVLSYDLVELLSATSPPTLELEGR